MGVAEIKPIHALLLAEELVAAARRRIVEAYGVVIGVLATLGVPMTFVSPQVWKRTLQVPAAKDGARARASQLMPAAVAHWPIVRHDGRAESALIATYGLRQLTGLARAA